MTLLANCSHAIAINEVSRRSTASFRPLVRSLQRLRGHHLGHSRHAHDVAGRHRELEVLIDPSNATVDGLANASYGLAPTEVFFDTLADRLADGVTAVACGAPIDGAAADSRAVAGNMGRDTTLAAVLDEVPRVVSLVGRNGLRLSPRHGVQHGQRRRSLAKAIGMRDHGADDQARTVLHQHMALEGKDGGRVLTLSEESRIGIGRAGVRLVSAPLTLAGHEIPQLGNREQTLLQPILTAHPYPS